MSYAQRFWVLIEYVLTVFTSPEKKNVENGNAVQVKETCSPSVLVITKCFILDYNTHSSPVFEEYINYKQSRSGEEGLCEITLCGNDVLLDFPSFNTIQIFQPCANIVTEFAKSYSSSWLDLWMDKKESYTLFWLKMKSLDETWTQWQACLEETVNNSGIKKILLVKPQFLCISDVLHSPFVKEVMLLNPMQEAKKIVDTLKTHAEHTMENLTLPCSKRWTSTTTNDTSLIDLRSFRLIQEIVKNAFLSDDTEKSTSSKTTYYTPKVSSDSDVS